MDPDLPEWTSVDSLDIRHETTDQPLIPLRAAVRACKSAATGPARVGIRLFTGQKPASCKRGRWTGLSTRNILRVC
jgi:hypothetical protein